MQTKISKVTCYLVQIFGKLAYFIIPTSELPVKTPTVQQQIYVCAGHRRGRALGVVSVPVIRLPLGSMSGFLKTFKGCGLSEQRFQKPVILLGINHLQHRLSP